MEERITLNVDTEESKVSIKDLRKELDNLKESLLNAEKGTDEYNAALKRSAEINRTLTDLNQEINQSYVGLEDVIANTGKVAGSLMQGMNGLRSITMLVAGSNSDAAKNIEKMMQVMTAAQGLTGIGGMIKGFKDLVKNLSTTSLATKGLTVVQRVYNAVLSANPIFGLLAIIMAVVGGIVALTAALKTNNDANERMNKLLDEQKKLMDNLTEAQSFNIEMMKAMGATKEELINQEIEDANTRKRIAEEQKKELEKRLENERGLTKKMKKELQERIDTLSESIDEEIKLEKDKNKELELERAKTNKQIQDEADKILDNIRRNNLTQQQREEEDLRKKYKEQKKILEDAKKDTYDLTEQFNKDLFNLNEKYREKEIEAIEIFMTQEEILNLQRKLWLEEDEKQKEKYRELLDKHYEELRIKGLSQEDQELYAIEQKYDKLVEAANGNADLIIKLNQQKFDEQMEVWAKYAGIEIDAVIGKNNKIIEEGKRRVDEEKRLDEVNFQNKMMMLDGVSSVMHSLSSLMESETEGHKALAGASVIIDTLMGIMGIWSGVKDPFLGTTVAAVQSAALGVMGAVNFKKIMDVKPKGGNNPSKLTGGNNPSKLANAGKINSPTPPSIDNSINFIRQAQTEQEYDMQGQPVKAYVVETELRDVSDRVNQTEQESSF